ncbi:hypothetical protein F511_41589 [Dorcoceras hygrometricum]|uniref:Uncharacterized protein n=1 Tax=Dorcoceras hygrometricum TaxID=472368 RepID=A0A2Z7A642_9LAMI|nr:hypothetical protein F511_41589 [Dorcoceras hygrometricum]
MRRCGGGFIHVYYHHGSPKWARNDHSRMGKLPADVNQIITETALIRRFSARKRRFHGGTAVVERSEWALQRQEQYH